ncbi:Ppx/GppA phosphatase family protein [Corynebacterium sp. 11A]|uniref:Ppx/GppA phosphatase family protein n=1 Tax=Corynebacterium sp. 11A TaxID=2080510 RepID=UPI00124C6584|nr:Ppx/GppA phosphatase family protein [Corynebacterium sp. 11A]
MTRLAAVDCGTNSLRLLISEVRDGHVRDIYRGMEIVRLGQGVDATGEFDPEALERTRIVLERYVDIMKIERVEAVRMVATSATRDAGNRNEFFTMTSKLLNQVAPNRGAEVISGEEEAQLSFSGAVSDLKELPGPYCVIDLGGGSTEFVVGTSDGEILGSHSSQMGCVRLTERIMRSDPPTSTEIDIAADYVRERLGEVRAIVPISDAVTFVGCAGTFTTLSALAQGLEAYEATAIHGSTLRFDALRVLCGDLLAQTSTQRAAHPVIHEGRADVISGGAMVVEGITTMIEEETEVHEIMISEKDILDGIINELARQRGELE